MKPSWGELSDWSGGPMGRLKATAAVLALLAIGLILLGIAAARVEGDGSHDNDQIKFDEIRSYWRSKFPTATFEANLHFCNGPLHERRIHVSVPAEVDELYHHSFSTGFLTQLADDPDGLSRKIAEDLILLRSARGPSGPSHTSYDGVTFVQCNDYVSIEKRSFLRGLLKRAFP